MLISEDSHLPFEWASKCKYWHIIFMTLLGYKKSYLSWGFEIYSNMSSVMSFTFNAIDMYVVTTLSKAIFGLVVGKCFGHWGMKKQPDKLSDITVVKKILGTNINWLLQLPMVWQLIGPGICKNTIHTSMRKGCMSCCIAGNSQKQNTSAGTATVCCFLMFHRNLTNKI